VLRINQLVKFENIAPLGLSNGRIIKPLSNLLCTKEPHQGANMKRCIAILINCPKNQYVMLTLPVAEPAEATFSKEFDKVKGS
jgi:hypothetical protein